MTDPQRFRNSRNGPAGTDFRFKAPIFSEAARLQAIRQRRRSRNGARRDRSKVPIEKRGYSVSPCNRPLFGFSHETFSGEAGSQHVRHGLRRGRTSPLSRRVPPMRSPASAAGSRRSAFVDGARSEAGLQAVSMRFRDGRPKPSRRIPPRFSTAGRLINAAQAKAVPPRRSQLRTVGTL